MEALRVILDVRELVGQPQLLMHLQVRDLAQSRGWTEGLSIQNSLSNSQSIFVLPFYDSLSSSFLTPSLFLLHFLILWNLSSVSSFSLYLHRSIFLFPNACFLLSPWHCTGNLILDCLEFPRIPFTEAPGCAQRQTSAAGAKSSKHGLIILPCSFCLYSGLFLLLFVPSFQVLPIHP